MRFSAPSDKLEERTPEEGVWEGGNLLSQTPQQDHLLHMPPSLSLPLPFASLLIFLQHHNLQGQYFHDFVETRPVAFEKASGGWLSPPVVLWLVWGGRGLLVRKEEGRVGGSLSSDFT